MECSLQPEPASGSAMDYRMTLLERRSSERPWADNRSRKRVGYCVLRATVGHCARPAQRSPYGGAVWVQEI